jgi:DNA/RNA-binding domain of Phe-tRNA-synthetase-like protein
MNIFRYCPDLLAEYPDVCGGAIYAVDLSNGPTSDRLAAIYAAEQARVSAELPDSLSDLPSLAAWRAAFRRFGANPTKHRSAAEALLRRLQKKGDIPSINSLVDIGNLVSIRYALPVAIFDMREVTGAISVHMAQGDERFRELGSAEVVHPPPGEVIFTDETKMVLARRWCWRQSHESAARPQTRSALVAVEAQDAAGPAAVRSALADLTDLLESYARGQVQGSIVDAHHPAFTVDEAGR